MKKCSKCGILKPLTEFYKNCRAFDGLRYDCKSCHKRIVSKYQSTDRGKEIALKCAIKYCQTEKFKIASRKRKRKYKHTERGKATEARYQNSPKGKNTKLRNCIRRRDKQKRLDENLTYHDTKFIKDRFHHQCFKCKSKNKLEFDHHYPLCLGFGLSLRNAVLLCRNCNAIKGKKLPEEFYSPKELEILKSVFNNTA